MQYRCLSFSIYVLWTRLPCFSRDEAISTIKRYPITKSFLQHSLHLQCTLNMYYDFRSVSPRYIDLHAAFRSALRAVLPDGQDQFPPRIALGKYCLQSITIVNGAEVCDEV